MMRKSSAPSQSRSIGNGIYPNSNYVRSIESVLSLLDKDDESETFDSFTSDTSQIPESPTQQKENTYHKNNAVHDQSLTDKTVFLSQSNNSSQFKVVWGNPSTKKHKTWSGDGFLELSEKTATLRDKNGAVLGTKSLLKPQVVDIGQILTIGSKVVEIIESCSASEYHPDLKKPSKNDKPIFRPLFNNPPKEKQQDNSPIRSNVSHEQSGTNNLPQPNNSLQFKVVWGKPSTKKHKTWDGDGFLEVSEKSATLRGDNGTVLGTKSLLKPLEVEVGQILTIGSKAVEVIESCSSAKCREVTKRPSETSESVYRPTKIKKKKLTSTVSSGFSNICKPLDMKWVQPLTLPPPPSSHQQATEAINQSNPVDFE